MGRARWAAMAAATACLLAAAPAHAQTSIEANDMEIDVGDAGELAASFNTDSLGQVLLDGSAGLQIDIGSTATPAGEFTADTPDAAVTGSGTAADPYTVVTRFHAQGVQVSEKVTHVEGDPRIVLELTFDNTAATTQQVRAIEWGDVAGGGFDPGSGTLAAGPPRYLAGVFPTSASVSGLEEMTPWDHYAEADDADLAPQLATGLNNIVSGATQDEPAVGAEWDLALDPAPAPPKVVQVAWRFVPGAAHIDLEPGDGSGPPDQPACFTATVTNVYGAPVTTPIEFSAGDPHPDLDTTTDAAGHAAYCAGAAEPGEELFVDASVPGALLDAFSTWEFTGGPDDTTGSGSAPAQPVAGSRLVARRVAGKVRLRHGTRYTTLKGQQAIKVGSTLDARHGTVELTALVGKHKQTARFGAGIFRIHQASASAPVALALAGAPFGPACKPHSHKVVRRLRATADRGRWQTVGRRSVTGVAKAAGWVTQDRCDGTLTVVRTGTATVHGAHGHRYTVRAGHRRLIRARSG